MSEEEKKIAKKLVEKLVELPKDKQEYLLGYADGIAAMTAKENPSA